MLRETRDRAAGVPLRRSLLLRLLAVSALVSVCSIASTAWVVVQTTAVAIRQEQGQALADDAKAYDGLVGYAARHPGWDGAGPTVASLAKATGHRIVLRDGGRTLADSDPEPGHPYLPPRRPTAVIDPLSVDPQLLASTAGDDGIDPRAVGPYRLSEHDRATLRTAALRTVECLRTEADLDAKVVTDPSGRPRVLLQDGGAVGDARCNTSDLSRPTASEQRALDTLGGLVDTCLARRGLTGVTLALDGAWHNSPRRTPGRRAPDAAQVRACVASGRAQQLTPYVAPPAQMYVSSSSGSQVAGTFFDLSTPNKLRIAGGAALVLLVTVVVTTLAGVRLVRPLRALTQAAQRMEAGDLSARVPVGGGDEIGRLSTAFNAMSRRREQLETVRKAMVSDVAHELRTPLSNIRGWLEAVEDGIARPDETLVASVLEEAVLLQHIIDDLRDLSAADAGELRLSKVSLDVADLLAQTALGHAPQAEARGVRLVVAPAQEELTVTADPMRLRQAVGNLVSNAIRHTPPGGTVTLRATRDIAGTVSVPAPGAAPESMSAPDHGVPATSAPDHGVPATTGTATGTGPGTGIRTGTTTDTDTGAGESARTGIRIEVSDTGSGLAPEDLPHVFDRFWRAEKSRSRESGGSGLGLSIVRKLTEAHGGTAEARSTLGCGSTFTLRLP